MRNTAMTLQETMEREGLTPERTRGIANGLGWFSIGLGLAELLAPSAIARYLGMKGLEPVVQAYGVREIVTGIGILASKDPTSWIWGRVAGDGLDVATLLQGAGPDNSKQDNVIGVLAMVTGIAAIDLLTAEALSGQKRKALDATTDKLSVYRRRSGMPKSPGEMRGTARDFQADDAFRGPAAMRPWS